MSQRSVGGSRLAKLRSLVPFVLIGAFKQLRKLPGVLFFNLLQGVCYNFPHLIEEFHILFVFIAHNLKLLIYLVDSLPLQIVLDVIFLLAWLEPIPPGPWRKMVVFPHSWTVIV